MRFYHPMLGKFVYRHKGSGIIVDNIFKPMRSVVSSVAKKFVKQSGKKALKSGISHMSEEMGKKTSEKSGDMIMERLRKIRTEGARQKTLTPPIEQQQQAESTGMIINRLISGSGVKKEWSKNYVI